MSLKTEQKSSLSLRRIPQARRQVVTFSRQFAVLLGAGIPLVSALNILAEQWPEPIFCAVIQEIANKISSGHRLSRTLAAFPHIFSKVFVGMVQAGEETGRLVAGLGKLSDLLERESTLVDRVRSVLTYPAFVLAFTGVLTLFMFYAVLPTFTSIFVDMHIELPLITRIIMFLTDAVKNPAIWCLVISAGLIGWVMLRQFLATNTGKIQAYKLILNLPLVGSILQQSSLARYCWALETVLESGTSLLSSLRLAAISSGSPILEEDLPSLSKHIQEGDPLSDYYNQNPEIYTRLMGNLITAGEESNNVAHTCGELGRWFNLETESRIDFLSASIEPLAMTLVAFIVGTIIISVFLPLYSYLGKLGV